MSPAGRVNDGTLDPREKRRLQNRVAQRKHRELNPQHIKGRLEVLLTHCGGRRHEACNREGP
jgi:hypothetical protein